MGSKLGTSLASVGAHSTRSQSNTGDEAFKIVEEEIVAKTITDCIRQIGYELKVGGWTVSRISRNQASLGGGDWFYLHGYIILELTREKEQVEGCTETGEDEAGGASFDDEKYYCRLDWGADGLCVQLDKDMEKLVLYEKKIEDWAVEGRVKFLSAAAAGSGASMIGVSGVAGYAWLSGVGMAACPLAAAAGAVIYAGGIGFMFTATAASIENQRGVKGKLFKDVGPHSNDAVMKFLDLELEKKKIYSIKENNCNHFAERMLNFVLENSK